MLIERVRQALAPDYEVLREVAGGGMGVVYAARQTRLDRTVAIKILRPELATAVASERFLAEGRLLARLAHPNIIPIYDAGEGDGLLYLVMEFVEGETLAERLKRGPLSLREASNLARDLLAALGAAHALGVVHRDVKPANIFLRDGRALLGDFGVARWREESDPALTRTGQQIGTPRYMSPEQSDGVVATPSTDVYAAGLVLWEATTGERWPAYQAPDAADWRRVPAAVASSLRRALALSPDRRWTDAREFAAALKPVGRRSPATVVLGVVGVVAALGIAWKVLSPDRPPPEPERAALTIEIPAFETSALTGRRTLGDSIAAELRAALAGFPDFYVPEPPQFAAQPGAIRIIGRVTAVGGRFRLSARMGGAGTSAGMLPMETAAAAPADWALLADTLALSLVQQLWRSQAVNDPWVPRAALPANPRSFALWLQGEQLWTEARWEEAHRAYLQAEQADSSCLLCSYRLIDIERWLGADHDPRRLARVFAQIQNFPPRYRSLIRAGAFPLPARLDSLRVAAREEPEFFLASMHLGDELFHRGPLYGRLRREAAEPLARSVQLAPRFGPGWEHLLWVLISEGDSISAAKALEGLGRTPPPKPGGFSYALQVLLHLGFHWRYRGPEDALSYSRAVLEQPGISQEPRAIAGARLLMTMDLPEGAVGLGGLLAARPDMPTAVRPALLGELFGFAALGRPDSVRRIGERLRDAVGDPALLLLAEETEALLVALDADPGVAAAPDLIALLEREFSLGTGPSALRWRAAWARGLLAFHAGDSSGLAAARGALRNEPAPARLGGLLSAAGLALRGDVRAALAALPNLPVMDPRFPYADPLEDAASHFLRARWLAAAGDSAAARRLLRWHEHLQLEGFATGDPEVGELAWAFGTLARWQRALLLGGEAGAGAELCSLYSAVARHWSHGAPTYAVRADSARVWFSRRCPGRI